jgi:hypothetical protein
MERGFSEATGSTVGVWVWVEVGVWVEVEVWVGVWVEVWVGGFGGGRASCALTAWVVRSSAVLPSSVEQSVCFTSI